MTRSKKRALWAWLLLAQEVFLTSGGSKGPVQRWRLTPRDPEERKFVAVLWSYYEGSEEAAGWYPVISRRRRMFDAAFELPESGDEVSHHVSGEELWKALEVAYEAEGRASSVA